MRNNHSAAFIAYGNNFLAIFAKLVGLTPYFLANKKE
jgi:hypothetical protein